MKRTRSSSVAKKSQRSSPSPIISINGADAEEVRRQITDLVTANAVPMVNAAIGEAMKGHYPAIKFLFELIPLYPAAAPRETPAEDSLTQTLLRRLGLLEEAIPNENVTKDQGNG